MTASAIWDALLALILVEVDGIASKREARQKGRNVRVGEVGQPFERLVRNSGYGSQTAR